MNQLGAGARKAWRQWRYNSRLRMERNEKRLAEQNAEIAARAKRYGTEDYLGGLAAAERAGELDGIAASAYKKVMGEDLRPNKEAS